MPKAYDFRVRGYRGDGEGSFFDGLFLQILFHNLDQFNAAIIKLACVFMYYYDKFLLDKASKGQWKSGIKVSCVHLQYTGVKVKVFSGKREVRLDNYNLILFTFLSVTLITFEKTFATL